MDSIFSHFLERDVPDTRRLSYAYWFVDHFPKTEFLGDELLFYEFITYCIDLDSPIRFKYLDVFNSTELRQLLIKEKTRVKGTESLDFNDPSALESAVRITATVMQDNFKALLDLDTNIDDFAVDISNYMKVKRGKRLVEILTSTFDVVQTKDDSESAMQYAQEQLSLLNDIYGSEILDDLVEHLDKSKEPYKICNFDLPAIDKDSNGIWSKQLIGVEAQPGTGKTRFTLGQIIYNAALNKKNCLFISLEQPIEELKAMLVAKHTFTLYDIQIHDSMILRNEVPEDYKAMVTAASIDLFESGKYGHIELKEEDLYCETFINKIKNWDKLNGPFDLIAIDYMGLIESKGAEFKKQKLRYEVIADSFRMFKRYLRHSNKAGVAISQFNKEGIAAGLNDKTITTDMAEGGITVYRNTDYNIAMSRNETMKLKQLCRLSQPKVRGSAGFGTVIINTRLGFCYFKQTETKEV